MISSPARNKRQSPVSKPIDMNLLVAAIILWNNRYVQASFDALRARGQVVTPDLVR